MNTITPSIIVAMLACAQLAIGQMNKPFPPLNGELLNGQAIDLPNQSAGKPTIIGLAYSKSAEDDLKSWYQPMYDTFILKRGMFDAMYDVQLYMVPMFTGMKKAAYETAIKKMREEHRKDLFPHILFYKGELEPYATDLKMSDKTLPYLFILDAQGKIVYHTSGAFTEKKKEAIESALDDLMD
jgi:hypothetical protein